MTMYCQPTQTQGERAQGEALYDGMWNTGNHTNPCQGQIQESEEGDFTTPIYLKPHPNDPFKGRGTHSWVKFDVTAQLTAQLI